jgi:adenylate cyclase
VEEGEVLDRRALAAGGRQDEAPVGPGEDIAEARPQPAAEVERLVGEPLAAALRGLEALDRVGGLALGRREARGEEPREDQGAGATFHATVPSECRLIRELLRLRGSLRVKWTLAVLGVAVVPTVVLGFAVLDIQRTGLEHAEKELEAAVVEETAANVLHALDQASDVASRILAVVADDRIDPDGRARLIQDIVGRASLVSGAAFFDEDSRFVDAVVRQRPLVDDGLQVPPTGKGFRILTLPDGAKVARFEAVLEGSARGRLAVGLARDLLGERLRDISRSRFAAPDRIALIDESFHVLAGKPPIVFSAKRPPVNSFAIPLIYSAELDEENLQWVGTFRTMPDQRWALVVERPREEAFGALTAARRAFVLVVVGLAVLALVVGAFVVRRGLRPIGSLVRLVERYGRREFRARSEVKSGDELEALGSSLERMASDLEASEDEITNRARTEANLRRYLPAEAADAAALGTASLDLGGTKTPVTIVFADVVAFTGFAERASPERAVAFLNEVFTMLSEIVFRHGGMVDKFIGDCIMAVFRPSAGGVKSTRDDVARALAAAEDMHAFVESNLPRWREAYAFPVELGIGIATGEVLLGNLGSKSRMEYTVIGDAVNVAARLEGLARPRQTLTTGEVVAAFPTGSFASLGEHALRGRAKMVEVFEVVP